MNHPSVFELVVVEGPYYGLPTGKYLARTLGEYTAVPVPIRYRAVVVEGPFIGHEFIMDFRVGD